MSTNIWDEEGKKMKKRRKELGMSQSDVALIVGVKQGAISKYEKGYSGASETRRKIWEALEKATTAVTTGGGGGGAPHRVSKRKREENGNGNTTGKG